MTIENQVAALVATVGEIKASVAALDTKISESTAAAIDTKPIMDAIALIDAHVEKVLADIADPADAAAPAAAEPAPEAPTEAPAAE